jgi:biopolymer transport protein ExbD
MMFSWVLPVRATTITPNFGIGMRPGGKQGETMLAGPVRENEAVAEMNTTPLIDVMLVLLTLLIITLPIQTHAVKLDLPDNSTNDPPAPAVDVAVDFDGTVTWNGVPMDRQTLDTYLVRTAQLADQPELHIDVNRLAPYDKVAMVLADAQRIGVRKIGFKDPGKYR